MRIQMDDVVEICQTYGITESAMQNYLYYDIINESEKADFDYETYVADCKLKHKTPLSKEEYLAKRRKIKTALGVGAAVATAALATYGAKKAIPELERKREEKEIRAMNHEKEMAELRIKQQEQDRLDRKEAEKAHRKAVRENTRWERKETRDAVRRKLIRDHGVNMDSLDRARDMFNRATAIRGAHIGDVRNQRQLDLLKSRKDRALEYLRKSEGDINGFNTDFNIVKNYEQAKIDGRNPTNTAQYKDARRRVNRIITMSMENREYSKRYDADHDYD